MNLYEKINKIREAIGYVQKDRSVSTGGGSYKAVTHDAVTGMLRKHMVEHGIVCVPNLVEAHTDEPREGAKQYRYRATYSFEFINAEKPNERLKIKIEAHAMDNADKAPGKAISYAKKYAVLKLFEIETGEDEESRYQQEAIDVTPMVEQMEKCTTLDQLRETYTASFGQLNGNKEAQKTLIAAKNHNKARIEKLAESAA